MLNKKILLSVLIIAAGLALMAGFNRPYRYWTAVLSPLNVNDMYETPAIKPFNKNSLRPPPEGSVPVDKWDPVPTNIELLTAPQNFTEFKNPVPASAESIKTGEELYAIYCNHCHGPEMGADPELWPPIKVGKLPGDDEVRWSLPAADINLVKLRTDEQIFAVITHGNAIMKRLSYHLDPEERWHIVNYLRTVINKHQ